MPATVTAVNVTEGSFELTPLSSGPSITVKIDSSTQIEDEISGLNSSALLGDINIGTDFVSVRGYDDGTGTVVASEVAREPADDIILQGIATTCPGTVVAFPYEGSTEFEDINDDPNTYANAADFCADVTPNKSIVKIKDKESGGGSNAIGVADEIDLEQL